MSSFRNLIGAGRWALKERLDHLQHTLAMLGVRLRRAVAENIGQAVGGAVRESFLAAVQDPHELFEPRDPFQDHYEYGSQPASTWRQPESPWQQPDDPEWLHDPNESEEIQEPPTWQERAEPANESPSSQLPVALTAGLRASVWWLRCWWGRFNIVGSLAAGLVAAILVYFIGTPAEAVLDLLESAEHLSALGGLSGTGAGFLK